MNETRELKFFNGQARGPLFVPYPEGGPYPALITISAYADHGGTTDQPVFGENFTAYYFGGPFFDYPNKQDDNLHVLAYYPISKELEKELYLRPELTAYWIQDQKALAAILHIKVKKGHVILTGVHLENTSYDLKNKGRRWNREKMLRFIMQELKNELAGGAGADKHRPLAVRPVVMRAAVIAIHPHQDPVGKTDRHHQGQLKPAADDEIPGRQGAPEKMHDGEIADHGAEYRKRKFVKLVIADQPPDAVIHLHVPVKQQTRNEITGNGTVICRQTGRRDRGELAAERNVQRQPVYGDDRRNVETHQQDKRKSMPERR